MTKIQDHQSNASSLSLSAMEALRRQAGAIRSSAADALRKARRDGDDELALPALLKDMERMKPIAYRFSGWRMTDPRNARHAWHEIDDAYIQVRDVVGGKRHAIAKAKREAIRSELDVILPASAKHVPNKVRSYPHPARPPVVAVHDITSTSRALSNDEVLLHLLAELQHADATISLPVYKVMVRERHRGVLHTIGDLHGLTVEELTGLPGIGRTSAYNLLVEAARRAGIATDLVADPRRMIPADRHERVLHALHAGLSVRFGKRETYCGRMQHCVFATDPKGGDRALGYNETDGVIAGMCANVRGKIDGLVKENNDNDFTTYSLTAEGRAESIRRFGAMPA